MIKLIASDMDGTLLNGEGEVPKEFFKIFKQLKDKNILFTAASGRQYYNLVNNFEPIKDDILFIAENGTFVVHKGKELYSNFLDRSLVDTLIGHGRKLSDVGIVLCGKKSAYIQDDAPRFVKEVEKYYSRCELVKNLKDVDDDILKFTLCDFKGSINNSDKVLGPLFKDTLNVVVSGELWLDIINKDINKGVAIRSIQEKLNISFKETMAFGDYYNDIEMLQSAYHSYAMENAPDDFKKHARFIAKSNVDNGVIHEIKRLVLETN